MYTQTHKGKRQSFLRAARNRMLTKATGKDVSVNTSACSFRLLLLSVVATLILSACGSVEISIETPAPSQMSGPGPASEETEEPVQAPGETSGSQGEGQVDASGQVTEPGDIASGQPVVGWPGYVVGAPEGATYDDYLVLVPEGSGEFGLASASGEIEAEIAGLRDSGKTITVWGQMICGVPDVNGCQIQVSRLEVEDVEVSPYEGWAFYTNVEYGFSFHFPPDWTLREAPEKDSTAEGGLHYGRAIQLEKQGILLYIGYRRASEDYFLGGTGTPAGDPEPRGIALFLGQGVEKTALVFEDKVKNVTYTPATVNDLTFVIRLDDMDFADFHEVDIPEAVQWEADKILGSFQSIPAHESWASYNASYTNSEYGFTFNYPPSWSLTEMPAVDYTTEGGFHYGRSLQLQKGATMLFIGYRWVSEDHIWWTGVGAWGDAISGGTVDFLGQPLEKTIWVYEGKVNYVRYPSVEANDLVFGMRMDYTAYADPQSVEIPGEDILEADQILESFTLITGVEEIK